MTERNTTEQDAPPIERVGIVSDGISLRVYGLPEKVDCFHTIAVLWEQYLDATSGLMMPDTWERCGAELVSLHKDVEYYGVEPIQS